MGAHLVQELTPVRDEGELRRAVNASGTGAVTYMQESALLRLIDAYDFEIGAVSGRLRAQLARHDGYHAVQAVPGVGSTLAAVFVAEIGPVDRFPTARHLVAWAGLTPRHRESDTVIRRGSITKHGSRLVRWAAIEAVASSAD
jgi:transposase